MRRSRHSAFCMFGALLALLAVTGLGNSGVMGELGIVEIDMLLDLKFLFEAVQTSLVYSKCALRLLKGS